ncbi:PH domain-containing protein [Occultella kanbiaonis]|uniref:PH domain-containing protein n=1 Tax=Occultella kanbiaonis TaxID=2675754 RepID=UPI0013D65638|nr:PH domain-containing protein [Occultella kanbiaonis]
MPTSHNPALDIDGVQWRPISARLIPVRQISVAIFLGLPGLVTIWPAVVVGSAMWILPAVLLALTAWLLWLVPRQVRSIGYAELEDDLLIRRGVMFRSLVVVPYGRMQYVDVEAGPIARKMKIAAVQLHTASAGSDASIPGLGEEEAARLRDQLTARGEARLAGL